MFRLSSRTTPPRPPRRGAARAARAGRVTRTWLTAAVLAAAAIWLFPPPAAGVQADPADGVAPVAAAGGEEVAGEHADAAEYAAAAEHGHASHGSIVAPLLAAIILILFGAKVSGDLFERIGIPSVVGELTLGIVLGNFLLITGSHALDFIHPPAAFQGALATDVGAILELLAEIGVILLLFEVGLECTVREMMRVGWTSLFVAIAGVLAPILLGYTISKAFFFTEPGDWQEPAFIGATLCATSVGITARVLRDMDRHQDKESQIILGAAVIDDVLGLIVLAVVQGAIAASLARALPGAVAEGGDDPFWWDVAETVGLAGLFLGGALAPGGDPFPAVPVQDRQQAARAGAAGRHGAVGLLHVQLRCGLHRPGDDRGGLRRRADPGAGPV